jgi:uncharacterized membrane protein YesL
MWRRGPDGEIIRAAPPPPEPDPEAPGEAPAEPVRKRAAVGLALRLGLRDTYDYLGSVLLMSALFTVVASSALLGGQAVAAPLFRNLPGVLPVGLILAAAFAAFSLVGGPVLAGIFRFARNAASREEPDLFNLAWGFRSAFRRSVLLALIQVFGLGVLVVNGYFYLVQRNPVLMVAGATFAYAALFWLAMVQYQWPLLVEQEIPTRRIVTKSALLVLDNLGFTALLLLAMTVFTAGLAISVVGFVLLSAGASAMILTQATRELLRKYDVLPPDPTLDPIADETHELRGHGWHE